MYTITLSLAERNDIENQACRYAAANASYSSLCGASWSPAEAEWDEEGDIAFTMGEGEAKALAAVCPGLAKLFGGTLGEKLKDFGRSVK